MWIIFSAELNAVGIQKRSERGGAYLVQLLMTQILVSHRVLKATEKNHFWATWYNFSDPVDKYLRESKSCTKSAKIEKNIKIW